MQGRRQFVIMPAKFNDKAVEIIMLWFKNLMVYRLSREISLRAEEMEKQLASMAFTPCGSQDMAKMGWVPPMGSHSDALTHVANGQIVICARKEEKILPSPVIKQALEAKIAKLEAEQGAKSGLLVVSDMQSAGRGRRGRSWESPAGTNIYYTLMLKPDFSSDCAPMLTLVMALAVAKGIRQTLRRDSEEAAAKVGIKWPNDIVVDGKKVCGILTEMSMEQGYIQHIVIGVGINVRKQEFPEEIRDRAAAIDEQCGFRISRSQLIADIMEAFEEDYEIFLRTHDLKGLRASYAELLVNQDREVCVLDPKGEYRGIARGINDQGELLVERPDGTVEEVYAGEVSVRGIYGYV